MAHRACGAGRSRNVLGHRRRWRRREADGVARRGCRASPLFHIRFVPPCSTPLRRHRRALDDLFPARSRPRHKRSAAQRLVQRHKWPRREGSNDGFARVLVPPDMAKPAPPVPRRADARRRHPPMSPPSRPRSPLSVSSRRTSGRAGIASAPLPRRNGRGWPSNARRSPSCSSRSPDWSALLPQIGPSVAGRGSGGRGRG